MKIGVGAYARIAARRSCRALSSVSGQLIDTGRRRQQRIQVDLLARRAASSHRPKDGVIGQRHACEQAAHELGHVLPTWPSPTMPTVFP